MLERKRNLLKDMAMSIWGSIWEALDVSPYSSRQKLLKAVDVNTLMERLLSKSQSED